jgi:hypothetical protein
MFLPVLLVRDYGVWGWIVFAIPNVVGAAAMGWVIRNAETSERIVSTHRLLLSVFSIVTIAFHFFFAGWIIRQLLEPTLAYGGVFVLSIVFLVVMTRRRKGRLESAVVALLLSLGLFALVAFDPQLPRVNLASGVRPSKDLIYLAPICAFGFLFCPYLDLTFHRARRSLSATASRTAFTIGFGALFLVMILFTLCYASLFPVDRHHWSLRALVGAHMLVQSGFTVGAHVRELGPRRAGLYDALYHLIEAVIALVFGSVSFAFAYHGLEGGEMIYRLFMGFYGLVFPAYVWLCIVPPRRDVRMFLISIIVAAPMFWMGFIEQRMIWLVPGMAVVLLMKLINVGAASAASSSPSLEAIHE